MSLSSLHAKVYAVDGRRALVTSANATFSGMHRNRECGIEVGTRRDVKRLEELIDCDFGTLPKPQMSSMDDLAALQLPVERLWAALPRITTLREAAVEAPSRIRPQRSQFGRVIESLSGWLELTMEGFSQIKAHV